MKDVVSLRLAILGAWWVVIGAPGSALAEPDPVAWPDGCVDRVEEHLVVLIGPGGEESEILLSGQEIPVEGACFRGGAPAPIEAAWRRSRAESLVQALSTGSPPPESNGRTTHLH